MSDRLLRSPVEGAQSAPADGRGEAGAEPWVPSVSAAGDGEQSETPAGGELMEAPRITATSSETDDGAESLLEEEGETSRGRWSRQVWDVAIGELPSVWSAPPTEPAALVRYAAEGSWCSPESRVWRRAGQVYCVVVAIPLSVACYVAAWVVQRPGRLAAAALLALIVGIVL